MEKQQKNQINVLRESCPIMYQKIMDFEIHVQMIFT